MFCNRLNGKRQLILLCVMFVVVSCVRDRSQDASLKPNIEPDNGGVLIQDFSTEEISIRPSQVIYNSRLHPEQLTSQQLRILSGFVSRTRLPDNDVWFVRVLFNHNKYLTAVIYFMPEVTGERIRTSKYVRYSAEWVRKIDALLKASDLSKEQITMPPCHEYVQVSLKSKPFTGGEVRVPPQNSMLPFAAPTDFSEQEIVEIVDFIRLSQKKIASEASMVYLPYHDEPIMSITREGEMIKVTLGTQEGPLAGAGSMLEIKKTDEGYELTDVSLWVS